MNTSTIIKHSAMIPRFNSPVEDNLNPTPPELLILDFDATDDRVHGHQEKRLFHGYYDNYCFLPLYDFCGDELLVSHLRSSKIDGAKHTRAVLKLLVAKLRCLA